MRTNPRILLVEHLDAAGASVSDLRPRAQVLRSLGADVHLVAITPDDDSDLQHGTAERRVAGIECVRDIRAGTAVRRAAERWRATQVVWASAAPGGGEAARGLAPELASAWWPTGWASDRSPGPLAPLVPGLAPGDAVVVEAAHERTPRLSLWDGPYALVASPLEPRDAGALFDGYASGADQHDEVDLVVLDHPDAELDSLARAAGIAQRVHFVGPAPREAECAWLQHARVTFVTLQPALAAGLVVRALAAGCPLLPVGAGSGPVHEWLLERGLAWARPAGARPGRDAVAAALARTPAVETALARGRAFASQPNGPTLAARIAPALAGAPLRRDHAA